MKAAVLHGPRDLRVETAPTPEPAAGEVAVRVHYPHLSAVPGFGEVHKHIESSHLTPEWEAALVVPRGNTWTCEASHEFANVNGERNLDMWFEARKRGSPLKKTKVNGKGFLIRPVSAPAAPDAQRVYASAVESCIQQLADKVAALLADGFGDLTSPRTSSPTLPGAPPT